MTKKKTLIAILLIAALLLIIGCESEVQKPKYDTPEAIAKLSDGMNTTFEDNFSIIYTENPELDLKIIDSEKEIYSSKTEKTPYILMESTTENGTEVNTKTTIFDGTNEAVQFTDMYIPENTYVSYNGEKAVDPSENYTKATTMLEQKFNGIEGVELTSEEFYFSAHETTTDSSLTISIVEQSDHTPYSDTMEITMKSKTGSYEIEFSTNASLFAYFNAFLDTSPDAFTLKQSDLKLNVNGSPVALALEANDPQKVYNIVNMLSTIYCMVVEP